MANAVLDQKKIDSLVSCYQDTEKLIVGSDEHLDIILSIQKSITQLTKLTQAVNNEIEEGFNSLPEEQAKEIVIKLTYGIRMAKQLIVSLRNTHPLIYEGIKSSYKELYIETKQLDEFIQDIIKYKLTNQDELLQVLKEIK